MTAKTYTVRESEIERRWYVVDATDETLGRLASRIARVLERQEQAHLQSHDGLRVTMSSSSTPARSRSRRDKRESKLYIRHSGYPHGLKEETLGHLLERRPEEVIRRAVKGMLPHNRLGAQQLRKLKVYAGPEHPHQAQRPEPLA
jgi:large subunit ribosomal protein L13